MATGSSFTHPITGTKITDHATQYVDDKTEMINSQGADITQSNSPNITSAEREHLFEHANNNSKIWTSMLWLSGGNLNYNKCFYYYVQPQYNYNSNRKTYANERKSPGTIKVINPDTTQVSTIQRLPPTEARRSLGVMISPNGESSAQIEKSTERATSLTSRLKRSKLSNKTKWTALNSVIEPGIIYPLMALSCTD